MTLNRLIIILTIILNIPFNTCAQDDLMSELEGVTEEPIQYAIGTFKGSRVINGHSVEMRSRQVLEFLISHRFGRLNSGSYELFGLDQSNIRLALEYGLSDRLNIGLGRSSFLKTYDGFVKYKFLKQSRGKRVMPLSVVGFSSITINTIRPPEGSSIAFSERLSYTHQLLIARKFNEKISLQMMPTLVHHNITPKIADDNNVFALGAAGRYRITPSVALNLEYYYQFNPWESQENFNSLAIGFDIETGGHVFQLHLTNSRQMIEKGFITSTDGNFFDGDIHFGFNISRVFDLSPSGTSGNAPDW